MFWVLKFFVFILLIQLNDAVYSIPDKVPTQIGASYTLMLVDDNIVPEQCFVNDIDGNITYSIDLTTPGLPLISTNTKIHRINILSRAKETNIMTSLGDGICGFKLDNLGEKYVYYWNISFIDGTGNMYSKRVQVYTDAVNPRVESQYIAIGSSIDIRCANNAIDKTKSLNFCQLYNPQGELVLMDRQECTYSKIISEVVDYGRWKCILNYQSNMIETEVYYDVFEKEENLIKTWHNETNTHVNIGCSITNSTIVGFGDYSNFCLMIRPDGKQFTLRPGLASPRYTSIHMNITNSICAMEIKKPLEAIEKGLWRCEHHTQAGYIDVEYSPIGGFINLSDDSISLPPAQIPKQIYAHLNESFSATCRVPYSSSYCYMRGPDGVIYPVEDNRGPTLGLCKFTKEIATLADNGTWFCGFLKKTGEPDDLYSFDVFVPELFKSELVELDTIIGGTVRLNCSTEGNGNYPLQYCHFVSPNGHMYDIHPEESFERMSYDGRGLKYGDCGIKINDVRKEDAGIWNCITRIGYNFEKPEVYSNIRLTVNENVSVESIL